MGLVRSLALATTLALAGCAGTVTVPILGGGPGTPGDPRVLDDALRGVQSAGYQPLRVDEAAGRFIVLARSDRNGLTRFLVQCFREGYVSIEAEGPGVSRDEGHLRLPAAVAQEYRRIALAVSTGIGVRR